MVLRIYVILLVTGIIGIIIGAIFSTEKEKRDWCGGKKYVQFINNAVKIISKLSDIYLAILILYSIFMLIYAIVEKHWLFMIIPILFFIFIVSKSINETYEILDFLTEAIAMISFIIWIFYTMAFCLLSIDQPINGEGVADQVELVRTIDILEFKQVPYTNITGGRYYIKSSPNSSYYYEVETERGGTTTKVIDGANNYVEKFESDEYADNPHIDVYRHFTMSYYKTWYGNEVAKESSSSYRYYIYMPKNSIFYEE